MSVQKPPKKTTHKATQKMSAMTAHGQIFSEPDQDKCLDIVQLHQLAQSFRDWAEAASRADVRRARQRILLIFLLIRYTGAKLSEVLGLDPLRDIDFENQFVCLGQVQEDSGRPLRKVPLSDTPCQEIKAIMDDPGFINNNGSHPMLNADPGFVRRKFYERAEACGFAKELGAPEILRKSRAVELMRNNMPLPAVQMLLGHSTPNLTSSYVSFSEDDIQHVTRFFMDKESARKTSARNAFFGKIQTIRIGDIQSQVELVTISGNRVTTIITNDSRKRLGLTVGKLITAEIKAPWVILQKTDHAPECSADNIFHGIVDRITQGEINTEYAVRISDGTELCSIVTTESSRRLNIGKGDPVWVLFSSFSVVLLSE
ncbi:MAG: TOBE domain-containing protein [Proteobacteria bacterium]|nr:TOBE domain-containing protein [Pseudomonadota bacterium]